MKIECKIQNQTSDSFRFTRYKRIRQIVFINETTVDIYTALLIGGNKTGIDALSTLDNHFMLEVEYEVIDAESTKVIITSENKIDQFDQELDVMSNLWGDCKRLKNQRDIIKELKSIINKPCDGKKLNPSGKMFYRIGTSGDKSSSIVCAADLEVDSNGKSYNIKGHADMHEGVDLISWVKSTIHLGRKIRLDEQVEYSVDFFPIDTDYKACEDYISIYFCAPEGYHMSDDSEAVVHLMNHTENQDTKNNINKISHNNKLYYKEWIDDYDILNRNIYRLNQEKMFKEFEKPYFCSRLDFEFELCTNTEKGSIQFVLGAVFSALMTYGVDMGRLGEMRKCFWPVVPADVQWYFLCMLLFMVVLRWSSKKKSVCIAGRDLPRIFLCIGIILEIFWVICSYVVLRLELAAIKELYSILPVFVLPCIYTAGMVMFIIYIVLTYTKYKKQYIKRYIRRDLIF